MPGYESRFHPMNLFYNSAMVLLPAVDWPTVPELRWQLAGFGIGVVILSFGAAGLSFYFVERKTADRSLVYFSLFSFLYAVRLIFRLDFLRSLVPASADFWKYSNLAINDFIDNFIIVPLTLFFMEMVQARWKTLFRWVLAFQVVFAATRFSLKLFHKAGHPVEVIYHTVIIAYCALLTVYPLSFTRERRMPGEMKVIYAGLAVFGLFVVRNNLAYLGFSLAAMSRPLASSSWSAASVTSRPFAPFRTSSACSPFRRSWKLRGKFSPRFCRERFRAWQAWTSPRNMFP